MTVLTSFQCITNKLISFQTIRFWYVLNVFINTFTTYLVSIREIFEREIFGYLYLDIYSYPENKFICVIYNTSSFINKDPIRRSNNRPEKLHWKMTPKKCLSKCLKLPILCNTCECPLLNKFILGQILVPIMRTNPVFH